jgi:3-phenylpropionate/trans-cinnamate dioxygenase ferredoxin reductase subunit
VNGALQTNDPGIYALGDCCSFPHPLFGGRRIRLEAWRNTQDQAGFLARSLIGECGSYAAVPWFWSDQYDLHLQIAGLPSEGSRIVRRDLGDGSVLDFHLTGEGRLVGASALGAIDKIGRDARIAEKLIASRATPDPGFLAKPGSKLKALLPA